MRQVVLCVSLSLVATAGCTEYRLVSPARVPMVNAYSLETRIPWSEMSRSRDTIWTVDGPLLDQVRFTAGLAVGDALFPESGAPQLPRVFPGMMPTDVVDFFSDSLRGTGVHAATTRHLTPRSFGAAQGFQFEVEFIAQDGLERSGIVAGAMIKGKLYVIMYAAARQHYFARYREEVLQLLDSIVLL